MTRPLPFTLLLLVSLPGCDLVEGILEGAGELCSQEVFTVITGEVGDDPDDLCDTETGECASLRAAMHSASFCAGTDRRTIRLQPGATYEVEGVDAPAAFLGETADRNTSRVGPNGLPHVRSALTIDGRGATIRRTGADPFRFVHVLEEGDLLLRDLRLEGGGGATDKDGGALYNEGVLTLESVTLADNQLATREGAVGGAIYNAGTGVLRTRPGTVFQGNDGNGAAVHNEGTDEAIVLEGTLFEDNGGGGGSIVFNAEHAQLTLLDSMLRENSSRSATVVSSGTLTVEGSTFTGNFGVNAGSVYSVIGKVTVRRSTFSGEESRGTGAIRCGGSADGVSLEDVTVFGTESLAGFAVLASDRCALTISNSIVANNVPADCGFIVPPNVIGASLDSDGTCGFALTANPRLDALAENGGPTLTHLPQSGSPAVDAGTGCLDTDQRGQGRPAGAACDIGAVEAR